MLSMLVACDSKVEKYVPAPKTQDIQPGLLISEGVLKVGVNAQGNSPFAGATTDRIIGVEVDIASALADSMGLKLEVVDVSKNFDAALADAKVDIVLGIKTSEEADYKCFVGKPYLESTTALFSLDKGAAIPEANSSASISAQASSTSAWEVQNQFGEEVFLSSDSLKGAFGQLSTGATNFVASELIVGLYAAQSVNVQVYPVAALKSSSGYSAGVLKEKSELCTYVESKLQSLVDTGFMDIIETKWLGSPIEVATIPLSPAAIKTQGEKQSATNDNTDQ